MNLAVCDGYREIAQFATIPKDDRRRDEMLQLAQRLSGDPYRCVALLWLYDDEKKRFHLDHHEPMEPSRRQSSVSLPRKGICRRPASFRRNWLSVKSRLLDQSNFSRRGRTSSSASHRGIPSVS